ncbi:MAG: hypothetical protein ACE15B_19545 [Bryobacteraceae bacterium]
MLRKLFREVLGRYHREGLRVFCQRSWKKWSRAAEYRADVYLGAKERLSDVEREIFRGFCLEGKGWVSLTKRTGLDRGNLFHALYRIEARLGQAFGELGLFPSDEYFLTVRGRRVGARVQEKVTEGKWWRKGDAIRIVLPARSRPGI